MRCRAGYRTEFARAHAEESFESCIAFTCHRNRNVCLRNRFILLRDIICNALSPVVDPESQKIVPLEWRQQMANQPPDDAKTGDRASRETKTSSKTVEAISSFVDGDHIADIMRMQQSV